MKVLITSPGGAGHVNQLVPLARALAGRGNDVLRAVPERAAGAVTGAGIPVAPLPFPPPVLPGDLMQHYPELRQHAPAELPAYMFAKLFGATHAPPMLAGLVPLVRDWRPELVVSDAAEFAGSIVAAEIGVPSVTKGFGFFLPAQRLARAADEVAPLWRSRGLEIPPSAGLYEHLYIDVYPPELQAQEAADLPRRQLMRPVSDSGCAVDGPLPLPAGDGPLVYLTMGTVFNNPGVFSGLVQAVAGLGVRVLVTVGPQGDPGALGEQPARVRVETYVPQTHVLPHCAMVVSHAGSGTMLASLELGIPQLCLPQGADQYLNAAAVAKAGAGLQLHPEQATPDAIAAAVQHLLDESAFRTAAERVGASIARMPTTDEVAGVLEQLARS